MRVFKRKSECYVETAGTINVMDKPDDKANQSRAEEVDIKKVIEKYGIMPIEMLNMAKQPLFIDNLGSELTYNERLKQIQEVEDYYDTQLPAKVRKAFRDSKDNFYNALITGNYEKFIDYKILEQDQIAEIESKRNAKKIKIAQLENQLANTEKELENLRAVKEVKMNENQV